MNKASLLVENARLWSEGAPIASADALAIADGRIAAVGRAADLASWVGPGTRRIDARGSTATPGLVDAHIHLIAWARAAAELPLEGARSAGAVAAAVGDFVRRHPGADAVVGRGWAADGWAEPPERSRLDAVSGTRPVLLHSRDFHSLWVNSEALRRAGVGRSTPDPPGGRLERDAAGEPTGVVREHATRLFSSLLPRHQVERDLALARDAMRRLNAHGVTGIHDFEGAAEQRTLRALARGPGPRLRILSFLARPGFEPARELGLESGWGDDCFRLGGLKLFADGTLGSRTAALLAPYDGTTERGLDLIPPEELRALVAEAVEAGLTPAIHAIGDRAVRSALDAFAAAGRALRSLALPPRIEHAQLVDPRDLGRFARLGVAASMQPTHCISDMDLARAHWGTRLSGAYPWNSLVRGGALLAFGSDAPVEDPSVADGLHAAVTRQRRDLDPSQAFVPAERLTLDEALRSYTETPARLSGTWPRLGRLAASSRADLVVWNEDLHRLSIAELHRVTPAYTVIDGEVVHESPELLDPAARGDRRARAESR